MEGMTVSIARLVRKGNMTLAECADRLGISRTQLEERLQMMERQGYLARIKDVNPDPECRCGHCCLSCCKRDGATTMVLFTLTQKGERLAREARRT